MNQSNVQAGPAKDDIQEIPIDRDGYRFIMVLNKTTNISYMKTGSKVKIQTEEDSKENINDQA